MQIRLAKPENDIVSDRPNERPSHIQAFPPEEIKRIGGLVQKLDGVFHQKPTLDILRKQNFDFFQYYCDLCGISKSDWNEVVDDFKLISGRSDVKAQNVAKKAFDLINNKILKYMNFLTRPDEYTPGQEKSSLSAVGARDIHFLKQIFKGAPLLNDMIKAYETIRNLESAIRTLKLKIARATSQEEKQSIYQKIREVDSELMKAKTPQAMNLNKMAHTAAQWIQQEMLQARSIFQKIESEFKKIDAIFKTRLVFEKLADQLDKIIVTADF